MTLLNRLSSRSRESGFTVTELLVVTAIVLTIGLIAVPMFLNQRATVNEAELRADLLNAATNIDESKVDNGGRYPGTLPSTIKLASDTAVLRYTYPYDRLDYCLQIIDGETTMFKSSNSAQPTKTEDCTYEFVVPSTKLTGRMKGFEPVLSWNTVTNATAYTIYKNNIPVKTVTMSAGSTAKTASYTLPAMNPTEQATFHIVVADGGNQSAQSNTVRLKAPIPTPTEPKIRILSKKVKDATTMEFVIGWDAVRYAQKYEVYDISSGGSPVRIATLGESTGSYTIELPRGEKGRFILRSVNEAGVSGDSNELEVSSEWDAAKIVSATTDPETGKIHFVFHEDTNGGVSPDYGWPNSKIRLKIVNTATGAIVYDVPNIQAKEYTTTKGFDRLEHRATIVPTTSTGEVLSESPPILVNYPKPEAPKAPTNFSSGVGGDADITPNRLTWAGVECLMSSEARYFITHDGYNSGWVAGEEFNIPGSWLAEGSKESFTIKARCQNANGISGESSAVATEFTTGLSGPDVPVDLNVPNRGTVANWAATTCGAGTKVEYSLMMTLKNGKESETIVSPLKTNSYSFADLSGGQDHAFAVAARCVKYDANGNVTASSSWTPYSDTYEWTTMYQAPKTPVLSIASKEYINDTEVQYRVRWAVDDWGLQYELYNSAGASNADPMATFNSSQNEAIINHTRGEKMSVFLVSSNPDHTSEPSRDLLLEDTWPAAKILSTSTDSYDGFINVKWQNKDQTGKLNPDWGGTSSFVNVVVKDTVTGEEVYFENLEGIELIGNHEFETRNPQEVSFYVTTSTGVQIHSDKKTVTFPPPGPPSAPTGIRTSNLGPGKVTPNRIIWGAVNCGRGTTEYMVTHQSGKNSGWIAGSTSGTDRFFDIPDAWVKQGFKENFTIVARCVNKAGVSDASPETATSYTVNINTPSAVTGLSNNKLDTVTWSHSTAPEGLSREYKVNTVKKNGATSTTTATTQNNAYTLTQLDPNTEQSVNVQVRYYNAATGTSSAWSPVSTNTTWITPKPKPGTPVLTLTGSSAISPTTQRYTLRWNAVSWGEGYRVVDSTGAVLKNGVTGTTTTIDLTRGIDAKDVHLVAYNTSAESNDSNEVKLHAPWPNAAIKSIETNRNGSASIVWQDGTVAAPTPDWGTPGYAVDLEIRDTSATGAIAYSKNGLTGLGHSTEIFANDSSARNKTYQAKITVTTATGDKIISGWSAIKFERPAIPARAKNVTSDDKGSGTVKNDRLVWDAVTCAQENTRAEYYVTYVPAGTNYASAGTNKKLVRNWTKDSTSVNIPQAHLVDMQGKEVAYVVLSRCVFNDSGDTSSYHDAVVDGDGYHEFTVGIAKPTKDPSNVSYDTASNRVNWTAAVCGSGTSPQYQFTTAKLNNATVNNAVWTSNTYYPMPTLDKGSNNSVSVAARCVLNTNVSKAGSLGGSADHSWYIPFPAPATPTISLSSKSYPTTTKAMYTISWQANTYAHTYKVYNASNNALLGTFNAGTSGSIQLDRGTSANVYVIASNVDASSAKSNTLALTDTWPTPAITNHAAAPYTGIISLRWQNSSTSPDWGGNDARFKVDFYNAKTGALVKSYANINDVRMDSDPLPVQGYRVKLTVTTSTGTVLVAPDYTVEFPAPGAPAAPASFYSSTQGPGPIHPDRVVWTPVACGVNDAEYLVTNTDGSGNSGWISGTATSGVLYYNVPQSWLKQGFAESFSIVARCATYNGTSPNSAAKTLTITPEILTPAAPTGLKNNGLDTVSWNASTPPTGLTREYRVNTTIVNGSASSTSHVTTNTSHVLSALEPNKAQTVNVQVRYYNASTGFTSAWSPSSTATSWTTPKPKPATPVIRLAGSAVNSATTQRYTISWTATSWAEGYRVHNSAGTVLANTTGTSANVVLDRGIAATSVYVVAYNTSAESDKSNSLSLSAPWPNAEIKDTTANRNGTVNVKWQDSATSPDWGNPGYKVNVEIRSGSSTGAVVASATGLTTTNWTSPAFANDSSARNATYYAKIAVTTATGTVLNSGWSTIKFERPEVPAQATNIRSDAGGTSTIKHDRVLWNAVTCAQENTQAEYWVGYAPAGTTPGQTITTGWVHARGWVAGMTSFNIPEAKLQELQGKDMEILVFTRCVFTDNGDASDYKRAVNNGAGYYNYVVGMSPPSKDPGTPTRASVLNNTINWTAATCLGATTPQYQIYKSKHNDAASTLYYTTSATSYALPSITDGSDQSVSVRARCILNADSSKASAYGGYSGTYSYRAPLPKPVAPSISAGAVTNTSATMAQSVITWGAVANAEEYVVYVNGAQTTVTSGRTYTLPITRGSAAARTVTVKAQNFSYAAAGNAASNGVAPTAPWPAASISSATSNQNRQITLAWQTGAGASRNPNWGHDSSKVDVYVKNAAGTTLYSSLGRTDNGFTTAVIPGSDTNVQVNIIVTTANGEKLTSPVTAVSFTPPAAPTAAPANFKSANVTPSTTTLTWNAVTCPTSGTSAQYLITHTDAEFGNQSSGWITGTSYAVPSSWLEQGRAQDYSIVARCASANGVSAQTAAASHTSIRIAVSEPAAPTGVTLTANNATTANISWNAVSCPSHLTAGYMVVYDKKNGTSYANYAASSAAGAVHGANTATSVTLTGLTAGTDQTIHVISRCYDANNSAITSTWAAANESAQVSWTTVVPVPAAPVATMSGLVTDPANSTQGRGTLSWTMPAYTEKVNVYRSNGTLVGTYTGTSTYVYAPRGVTQGFYVRGVNKNGVLSANSNTVNLTSAWPGITLSQTSDSGTAWGAKWATSARNPDWGANAKFAVTVKQTAGNTTSSKTTEYNASTISHSHVHGASDVGAFSMQVVVTTESGTTLTSNTLTRNYVAPPTGKPGLLVLKDGTTNVISWTGLGMSCPANTSLRYVVQWKANGSASVTNTYTTTATQYTLNGNAGSGQKVTVSGECYSTTYGASDLGTASDELSYTQPYPAPTSTSVPGNFKAASGGNVSGFDLNRLTWNAVTCQTGSSVSYTVKWTSSSGQNRTATTYNTTTNSLNLTAAQLQQGRSEGYTLTATCTNSMGSATSALTSATFTQPIDAPAGNPVASHQNQMGVTYSNVVCPAGTQSRVRWSATILDGVAKNPRANTAWLDTSVYGNIVLYLHNDSSYGMPQAGYVESECFYDNKAGVDSQSSVKSSALLPSWRPEINTPKPTISVTWPKTGVPGKATVLVKCYYGSYGNAHFTFYNGSTQVPATPEAEGGRVRSTNSDGTITLTKTFSATTVTRVQAVVYCGAEDYDHSKSTIVNANK